MYILIGHSGVTYLIVALNVRVGHCRPVYGYAKVLGWIREDIVVEKCVAADLAKMCVGQSHLG
jgi:hypothetical protein